jgi:hypothetical protein
MPCRPRATLAAALAAALLPAAAPAEELRTLVLPVGATQVVGGDTGRCDDPSVATISLDATAKVTAVKVGTTLCSARTGAGRQVFRVQVVAAEPAKSPAPAGR